MTTATEPDLVAPVDIEPHDELVGPESDVAAGTDGQEPGRRGQVLVSFGPKGGVGTTVFATNLASALAADGRRTVCLVDLDLEFGDIAIITGVAPTRTIVDAAGSQLDDDVLASITTALPYGVAGVLAPIDPAAGEVVDTAFVAGLLTALRERYEYVVVDTPSALGEIVLEVLDAADRVLLVTTPELPALKNLRLVLDTLDLLGNTAQRHVVLNAQDERRGLNPKQVSDAIRTPIGITLPLADAVLESVATGKPLLAQGGDTPYALAIRAFVADVAGEAVVSRKRFRLPSRKRAS